MLPATTVATATRRIFKHVDSLTRYGKVPEIVQVFPLSKQQTWELLKELSSIVLLSVKFQTLNVLDGPYLRNLPIKSLNLKSYLLVNWPLTLMYIVPPKFTLKLDISFLWKSFPKSPTPRHPGATETEVWYDWTPKSYHPNKFSEGMTGCLGYVRFREVGWFFLSPKVPESKKRVFTRFGEVPTNRRNGMFAYHLDLNLYGKFVGNCFFKFHGAYGVAWGMWQGSFTLPPFWQPCTGVPLIYWDVHGS